MKRQVSIEEISDGKLYTRNDMVKAGCGGCQGCSACCSGMGNTVVLDPMDIYRLTTGLELGFQQLMEDKIELNVVDGIILPNLKMSGDTETCAFLDAHGRCSIHGYRPGICRLFPLGRYYTERTFHYFLQVGECPYPRKTKVKVGKWVDTPKLPEYEKFVNRWHYFLEAVQAKITDAPEEEVKNASLYILKLFFLLPYDGGQDFYGQFERRMEQAEDVFFDNNKEQEGRTC